MGTRGTCGFRIDGQDKLMYNHFDSYPEHLGAKVLKCAQFVADLPRAEAERMVREIRLVAECTTPNAEDMHNFKDLADTNVSSGALTDWYVLLRNMQGDLHLCLDRKIMLSAPCFIQDSLFCEYGYIINLDSWELEYYSGVEKAPHHRGRYGQGEPTHSDHYGVPLVLRFPMDSLPDETEFLEAVVKPEAYHGGVYRGIPSHKTMVMHALEAAGIPADSIRCALMDEDCTWWALLVTPVFVEGEWQVAKMFECDRCPIPEESLIWLQ